jgi:hypothetical protein
MKTEIKDYEVRFNEVYLRRDQLHSWCLPNTEGF